MRARMALLQSGQAVELREIVLRDKPEAFLEASPSASVPCLVDGEEVLDESLDVMKWALARRDPDGWLDMPDEGWDWIARADGPFKDALDRTKYAPRYPGVDPLEHRALAAAFLTDLDAQIAGQVDGWIFGRETLADHAILPFVRQFAFIDKPWFDAQPWPALQAWLARYLSSDAFGAIMPKYAQWVEGEAGVSFPSTA